MTERDCLGPSIYRGARAGLLTQHGKEQVVGGVLSAELGVRVERVAGVDTDTLGTFTREIPRAGTQRDAATRKAELAIERSGLTFGLGSEGAFTADPWLGLTPWNIECLVFLDRYHGIEVVAWAQGEARSGHEHVGDWAQAAVFAEKAGFPEHWLVLRPEAADHPHIVKGLSDWASLREAFEQVRSKAANGMVFLENDLRAHTNPTRRGVIKQAAEDLARRLSSQCPACGTPGFWIVEAIPGLPCALCGSPTRVMRADLWGCLKCDHRVTRARGGAITADPGRCDVCNP